MGNNHRLCLRAALSVVVAGISLAVLVFVYSFGVLQMLVEEKQFLEILVHAPHWVFVMPGFVGTLVVVVTLVDVISKRRRDLRHAVPLIVCIILFNVLGTLYYWLREFWRITERQKEGSGKG